MSDRFFEENPDWQLIVKQLSEIRESGEFGGASVEFIREQLQSEDDRIRGAAALAAEGCLFEPFMLDQIMSVAEFDPEFAIQKAAIRSLSAIISFGVKEGFEDEIGASTQFDDAEEWDEIQSGGLQDDYQRARSFLLNLLEFSEDQELQEAAMEALADIGFQENVRARISEMLESGQTSSRLTALRAIGRYPQLWEAELISAIRLDAAPEELCEAISAAYSATSSQVAEALTGVLSHEDPEVLVLAITALSHINRTPNIGELLQKFVLHDNDQVQEAARAGIEEVTQQNFQKFISDDLGMMGD